MNLDDLTLGEARKLAAMFCGSTPAHTKSDPLVGRYVICRCKSAGVHAGELVNQEGDVVLLKASRRLWSWKAKKGVALSGVAENGIASESKIDSCVSLIRLTGVIETIACSVIGQESIQNA